MEDAFERNRGGEDFDDLVALFLGERAHRLARKEQGEEEDDEHRAEPQRLLYRDTGAAARQGLETGGDGRERSRRARALHCAREQGEIAARTAVLFPFDDARRGEVAAHDGIGVGALFARDGDRIDGGGGDAEFEQRGLARHDRAQPCIGGAQCLDIGGIGNRDDAAGAARAVGELRRAHAAREPHADHEQRREQEEQEGRRRDDREKVAPRNHEHVPDERGHALASSTASSVASASKPASTWRTIWTKASWSAGRLIDRPVTP